MTHKYNTKRSIAVLTAAVLAIAWTPTFAVSSVDYNAWTGYVLRNTEGQYLSVCGGTPEAEGSNVIFYEADGVAPYNTWYFTETTSGITIKSALFDDEYYLTIGEDGGLILSTDSNVFTLSESGQLNLTDYGQVTPEAVTNLYAGDMNQDLVLDGTDLAVMRQLIVGDSDFVQTSVGDVTGDGIFDDADAALLQQYLLGEDVTFAEIQLPSCTIVLPPASTAEITEMTTTTTATFWYDGDTTTTTSATTTATTTTEATTATTTVQQLTLEDMPTDYVEPMEWIWENRIEAEQSTARWNLIFDQIIAGDGTLNYVVRWQSYKTVTFEQRQEFETLVEESINAWTDWLIGYDDWEYDHVDVNIVGWAVLDESVLLDLQDDEVVYSDLIESYDSSGDTSNGTEEIPSLLPSAPSELWRFEHFTDRSYVYPGTRFDMYLWATQGWPSIGGCGGDWGQRLSDDAYLNMLDGTNIHVLEHEIGHGFGLTDFYGGEGESDGYPPGGFPDDGTSIMMAGSSTVITDFDGWMLRYVWSMIKDEEGRFS